MNASYPAYMELVDFIASGTTPESIICFHPSEKAYERITELIKRKTKARSRTKKLLSWMIFCSSIIS